MEEKNATLGLEDNGCHEHKPNRFMRVCGAELYPRTSKHAARSSATARRNGRKKRNSEDELPHFGFQCARSCECFEVRRLSRCLVALTLHVVEHSEHDSDGSCVFFFHRGLPFLHDALSMAMIYILGFHASSALSRPECALGTGVCCYLASWRCPCPTGGLL